MEGLVPSFLIEDSAKVPHLQCLELADLDGSPRRYGDRVSNEPRSLYQVKIHEPLYSLRRIVLKDVHIEGFPAFLRFTPNLEAVEIRAWRYRQDWSRDLILPLAGCPKLKELFLDHYCPVIIDADILHRLALGCRDLRLLRIRGNRPLFA